MFYIVWECVDDGNNLGYSVDCDSDVNVFSTEALKDITKSGLGTAGREVSVNAEFLVFLAILLIIIGMVSGMILHSKGFFKGNSA